jgi:hypothetical protein
MAIEPGFPEYGARHRMDADDEPRDCSDCGARLQPGDDGELYCPGCTEDSDEPDDDEGCTCTAPGGYCVCVPGATPEGAR